jgi:hypothetical protein
VDIPADWRPSVEGERFAADRGFTPAEIADVAFKFKNLFSATGERRPDWSKAWSSWTRATVGAVQDFSAVFDARARAHGWTTVGLYGLSRLAPWADVSRLGAAWIVARSGHRVAGIDRDGILLISPNCDRVRIYRVEPDDCCVEAWALCKAARGG